jgi:hypothetical protein
VLSILPTARKLHGGLLEQDTGGTFIEILRNSQLEGDSLYFCVCPLILLNVQAQLGDRIQKWLTGNRLVDSY